MDEPNIDESGKRNPPRIPWHRCKVPREELSRLNKRSNFKGFLQTGGYLGVLAASATLAIYSGHHWPWYATVPLVFLHGTFAAFLINAHHELVHDSVFRTRWLNAFFLRIFTFLGWQNHHWFWASHTEHHKYTLHDPDDLEVVLPIKMSLRGYLQVAIFDPRWIWQTIKGQFRRALGNHNYKQERWTEHLFPKDDAAGQRKLVRWARVLLIGHGLIAGVSLAMGWWMVPIVITIAPSYGRWLQFLCNECQHVGLMDKTPDFRLCCRTIYVNPFVRFLYWHMNYHIEHHSFAAVPCYNLGRLHRLIKPQLPPSPRGLIATWRQIAGILRQQKIDPSYQYRQPLPEDAPQAAAPEKPAPAGLDAPAAAAHDGAVG